MGRAGQLICFYYTVVLFTQDDIADSIDNEVVVGSPLDFQHTVSFLPEISFPGRCKEVSVGRREFYERNRAQGSREERRIFSH
jgi:hypothetical protein